MSIQPSQRAHAPATSARSSAKVSKTKQPATSDADTPSLAQPNTHTSAIPTPVSSPVPSAPRSCQGSRPVLHGSAACVKENTESKVSIEPKLEPRTSPYPGVLIFTYTHRDGKIFTLSITGEEAELVASDLEKLTQVIAERVDQLKRIIPNKNFSYILFEIPKDANKMARAVVYTDNGEKRYNIGGGERDKPPTAPPFQKPSWFSSPWKRAKYALHGEQPTQDPEALAEDHSRSQKFDADLRQSFLQTKS